MEKFFFPMAAIGGKKRDEAGSCVVYSEKTISVMEKY